jgi:hypothetical protein
MRSGILNALIFMICLCLFYLNQSCENVKQKVTSPVITKLGTIDCDLVETTPVVFKGRLYRFEYVRKNYKMNQTGDSYFRFIDHETGEATPSFAKGYHLEVHLSMEIRFM